MKNNKQLVKDLLASLNKNISADGVNHRREITQYVLGTESMDEVTRESASASLTTLRQNIDMSIAGILTTEDGDKLSLTSAQMNAAASVAALAIDPTLARASLSSLRPASDDASAITVSAYDLGVEDAIDASSLSTEAFDGQDANNALYFSITYNLLASRQDKFGEAFFPTIAIDPANSGASISSEYISLYNEISRSKDGSTDGKKFNKVPIVKAVYNNEIFTSDRNKVVPVLRTENAALLLADYSYTEKSSGVEIVTAPIRFGKKVGLLGISQTDAMLNSGVMDNTDALDRRLVAERLYFSITDATDPQNVIEEMFDINIANLPNSNFTYSPQDHNKDLIMGFSSEHISINTSNTLTSASAASDILAALPANHTITFNVSINGSSNTQHGDTVVYANIIEIASIKDASGKLLNPTSADYVAIAAAINGKTKLEGYTLEAYRTNSNLRTRGQLLTSDRYNQIYTVPLRSGISVQAPVNNGGNTDNDATKINNQITYAGLRTSAHAVKTLVEYAGILEQVTLNGTVTDVPTLGVGRHHVDPYFKKDVIDLSTVVDSIKSSDRLDDLSSVLVNKIKNYAVTMAIKSNYMVANEVERGALGGKITVIIGTDPYIAQYIESTDGKVDLGDGFEGVLVSTYNQDMAGKVMITFGVFDSERNTKPNALNFGQCLWAPTITTNVTRSVGGSTIKELVTNPRFLHVPNLPCLVSLTVTNLAAALDKINVNFKNV